MKLLGWMHRKLKENSVDPFKEFTTGNLCGCFPTQPSLFEQQYYPFSSANSRQHQRGCQKSTSEYKTKKVEEVYEEEPSIMITTPFDGFLTIGTLGSEPITTEPSTPTFPMPFEKIMEKETEVTENDLKFINDELEKFLEAEAKEVSDESSARSSHVSIITLCGKPIEGVDTEEYGDIAVCPLQGYLFGSSVELPETSIQVKKERTSLGQLFKMNSTAHDPSTNNCEKVENTTKKTDAMSFMKKMLKKIHSSPCSSAGSAADGATADPVSAKRKIPKVLRMFHKKVHPERSTAEDKFTKSQKCQSKKKFIDCGCNKGVPALQDKNDNSPPLGAMLKKEITDLNLTRKRLSSSGLTQKKEHWIKTDVDYLVLEL